MASRVRKQAPLFPQRQGAVEPSPHANEVFGQQTKSGHPTSEKVGYRPPAPGGGGRRQTAPQAASQPARAKDSKHTKIRESRSMHGFETVDRSDPLRGTDFEEEGIKFRPRVDNGRLDMDRRPKRAPLRARDAFDEAEADTGDVDTRDSSPDTGRPDANHSDDEIQEVKPSIGNKTVKSWRTTPQARPDNVRAYETDDEAYLGRTKHGHARLYARKEGNHSVSTAGLREPAQHTPSHSRIKSQHLNDGVVSERQESRESIDDGRGREQYRDEYTAQRQKDQFSDARRVTQPEGSVVDDESLNPYDSLERPRTSGNGQSQGYRQHNAPQPDERHGRADPSGYKELRLSRSDKEDPFALSQHRFHPSQATRSKSAAPYEQRLTKHARAAPPDRVSAEAHSYMMSMQRLIAERASFAQASADWQRQYEELQKTVDQLSHKADTEAELEDLNKKCRDLRIEVDSATIEKQKLAARAQKRCSEADCLIEVQSHQIDRLKAQQSDYIAEVVTLKELVKQVNLDGREAAKAVAAGRTALEDCKSLKRVYDQTESELREVKDKLEEAEKQSDEAKNTKEAQCETAWQGLDHVMDVKDRELLRLKKGDPIKELVRLVKDRHDSLADVQVSDKLKFAQAQEKQLHTTLTGLAAVFGTDLPGVKQEQLSTFVLWVKNTLEKRDEERQTAAQEMTKLAEAHQHLHDKLKNAEGSTLAQAQKDHYEESIANLQTDLDAAELRAGNVQTLQHEVDRLKTEVDKYKGKAETSKQEATHAKSKAIEERNIRQDQQKQKEENEAKHKEEVRLHRRTRTEVQMKASKDNSERLERQIQALIEENTGLKQANKPNGVGVGASTVHAEEKKKLEATIDSLKARLADKEKDEAGIVERWKKNQSTEEDQVIISALDAAIESATEAKYEPKLRELREENNSMKKRIRSREERITELQGRIKQQNKDAEAELSDSVGHAKDVASVKSDGSFVPASGILKQQQSKRRTINDVGRHAQDGPSQKKPRFANLASSDDPVADDQHDRKQSSSLSPVDEETNTDEILVEATQAPPSTQNPRKNRSVPIDLESESETSDFERSLAEMPVPKSVKAARVNDESEEDEWMPPASQSKPKAQSSQTAKKQAAAKPKTATTRPQIARRKTAAPK